MMMTKSRMHSCVATLVLPGVLVWILLHHASAFRILLPEFADPVKNISVPVGSNVWLTCNVRNLGPYRVMWLKREEEKEVLMAINSLQIVQNTRVSVSVLPHSGDVTQSTLYINNVDGEDHGSYKCIVNTSPMISQVGTVEVREASTPEPEQEKAPKIREPQSTPSLPPPTTTETAVQTTESTTATTAVVESCPMSACEDPDRNIICIDLDNMWTQTKDKAQYLFSWFYGTPPSVY